MVEGDIGAYVFSQTEDMLAFFSNDDLSIDPVYWTQILQATSKTEGHERFTEEAFEKAIERVFSTWEFESQAERDQAWQRVQTAMLCATTEEQAWENLTAFKSKSGYPFQKFGRLNFRAFTPHYIWCLFAIVWGIQQYQALRKAA